MLVDVVLGAAEIVSTTHPLTSAVCLLAFWQQNARSARIPTDPNRQSHLKRYSGRCQTGSVPAFVQVASRT